MPTGYNLAELFIKNYLDILEGYAGLSEEEMSKEKLKLYNEMIIPWCNLIKSGKVTLTIDGIENFIEQYYRDEPYYDKILTSLQKFIH